MPSWTNIVSSLVPAAGQTVPTRAEDLSAEWLSACLAHAGVLGAGASVRSFTLTRIGQGRGYAGRLARVSMEYEPALSGPPTLIGKFATEHEATREMMSWVSGYQREVRFYRELAERIGVSTPRCYFAHYDEAAERFCLLLEDLSPAASVDAEAGLDLEHAKLVLDQIATMHARWWNRTEEVPWLSLSGELLFTVRDQFLAALPGFHAHHAARYPETARVADQVAVVMRDDALLATVTDPPLTLAHNDLHLDNVFLPNEHGGRFALIDWQGIAATRHGTGDVSRILCVGMRTELRRKHQRELLAHYHARLCQLGVRDFSLRQLRRRFREELAATVMIGVMAFDTLDFEAEGGARTVEIMGERIEQMLLDGHVALILSLTLPFYQLRHALRSWLRRALGFLRLGG